MAVLSASLKGGGKGTVIVTVAAVLNIIVVCVAFALVSRSLDELELNMKNSSLSNIKTVVLIILVYRYN